MRLFLLFLLFFFCITPSNAQRTRHLKWQSKAPLQWAHFQGKPEAGDKVHAAVTYAGIEVLVEQIKFPSGQVRFKAHAIFDKKSSWVKKGPPDSKLLAHEQLHFDITEVYARKLMQKLNSLQLSKKDKAQVNKWQNRYWQAQQNAQEKYDEESVHGVDAERQQTWRALVDAELQQTTPHLKLEPRSYTARY